MAARLGRDIMRVQIPHWRPIFNSVYINGRLAGPEPEDVGSIPTTVTKYENIRQHLCRMPV